jgi:selenocysteine lyase/cysteine desulfurase
VIDAGAVVAKLRTARIAAAPRQGWVRTSPHFYIDPAEIDRMLDVLPAA